MTYNTLKKLIKTLIISIIGVIYAYLCFRIIQDTPNYNYFSSKDFRVGLWVNIIIGLLAGPIYILFFSDYEKN